MRCECKQTKDIDPFRDCLCVQRHGHLSFFICHSFFFIFHTTGVEYLSALHNQQSVHFIVLHFIKERVQQNTLQSKTSSFICVGPQEIIANTDSASQAPRLLSEFVLEIPNLHNDQCFTGMFVCQGNCRKVHLNFK